MSARSCIAGFIRACIASATERSGCCSISMSLTSFRSRLRWFSYNRPNVFSFYDATTATAPPHRSALRSNASSAMPESISPAGGFALLCMPRTLGYCFNPISIFFCYRADGSLAALIYQVHNTFGERHSYVIRVEDQSAALHQRCRKLFYVSPFLDMDLRYDFRITGPDERIAVGISRQFIRKTCAERRVDRNAERTHRSEFDVRIPENSGDHDQGDRGDSLGGIAVWAKGIGLRRRPSPPERTATIVTTTSASSD